MAQEKEISEKKPQSRTLSRYLLIIGITCFIIAAFLSFQLANTLHGTQFTINREASINQIESWMTLRYISHTYHVPEGVFMQKLSITPRDIKMTSLERIARKKNIPTEELIKEVQQTIIEFSTSHINGPAQKI